MELKDIVNVSVDPVVGTITIKSRYSNDVMKVEAATPSRGIGLFQVLRFALGVGISSECESPTSELREPSPTVVSVHPLPSRGMDGMSQLSVTSPPSSVFEGNSSFSLPSTPGRVQILPPVGPIPSPDHRQVLSEDILIEGTRRGVCFSSAPPDVRSLSPALQSLRVLSPTWSPELSSPVRIQNNSFGTAPIPPPGIHLVPLPSQDAAFSPSSKTPTKYLLPSSPPQIISTDDYELHPPVNRPLHSFDAEVLKRCSPPRNPNGTKHNLPQSNDNNIGNDDWIGSPQWQGTPNRADYPQQLGFSTPQSQFSQQSQPTVKRHVVDGMPDLYLLVYIQNGIETLHLENTAPSRLFVKVGFKDIQGMTLEPIGQDSSISEIDGLLVGAVSVDGGEVKVCFRLVPSLNFRQPSCKYKVLSAHVFDDDVSIPVTIRAIPHLQLRASEAALQIIKPTLSLVSFFIKDEEPHRGAVGIAIFRSIVGQSHAREEFVSWSGIQTAAEHHVSVQIDPLYKYLVIVLTEEGRMGDDFILRITGASEREIRGVRTPDLPEEHEAFVTQLERTIVSSSPEATTTGYIAPGAVDPCGFITSFAYQRWMALFARNTHRSLHWRIRISFSSTPSDWRGSNSVELVVPPGGTLKITTLILQVAVLVHDAPPIEWDISWKWC
eukprot:TRINITY_DN9878_c0_g1_i1.p1 TRINITY_DN9878_c0_g1~~TRINITY_DN9878_c0_g1_i1.p1  ORF type:complete len:735 (+),score=124.90 TRINITY_DN9878_c0_g1_i1:219-2207(+)